MGIRLGHGARCTEQQLSDWEGGEGGGRRLEGDRPALRGGQRASFPITELAAGRCQVPRSTISWGIAPSADRPGGPGDWGIDPNMPVPPPTFPPHWRIRSRLNNPEPDIALWLLGSSFLILLTSKPIGKRPKVSFSTPDSQTTLSFQASLSGVTEALSRKASKFTGQPIFSSSQIIQTPDCVQ